MRLAAQAKGGYYPTPERVVDLIAELIHTPTGYYHRGRETIRILDPCCGAGDALQRLAERLDRAEEAEKRLHRTLASDLFATSIANGAFGLLLLNPPYDFDSEDKRTEHAFLTQTTRYLAESGLLVFIVPRQRLAVSARYLSTHYGRMRCWTFPDPERQVFDQVVLFGYRKADPVPDAPAESMVLEWAVGEPEPLRSQRNSYSYPEYTPATTPSGDVLFTTRTVDPVAAAAEARRSGLVGGGLPRQPGAQRRRQAHPGQGPHLEGDGVGRGRPGEGGPPREADDDGGGPRPGRRTHRGHRRLARMTRPELYPRGPVHPLRETGGASLRLDATDYTLI